MKIFRLALTASLILGAYQVNAFSQDDKSMNSPSAAAKFSDPDDQMPSAVNLQGGNSPAGGVDPSSIRYDYDPASGSYVPHRQ